PETYEYNAAAYWCHVLLSLNTSGTLCGSVNRLDPASPSWPPLPASVVSTLQSGVGTMCVPLTPAAVSVSAALGMPLTVRNAVLTADGDVPPGAVRLEFIEFPLPAGTLVSHFQGFADGAIGPILPMGDWSVFIGHKLFTASIQARFLAGIDKKVFTLDDFAPL